jgi:hypothetical protein
VVVDQNGFVLYFRVGNSVSEKNGRSGTCNTSGFMRLKTSIIDFFVYQCNLEASENGTIALFGI